MEQTFGGLARWFHGQVTRFKGLEKVHNQPVLESIAYKFEEITKDDGFHANLKRRIMEKRSLQSLIRLKNEEKKEPNKATSEKYRDFLEESHIE